MLWIGGLGQVPWFSWQLVGTYSRCTSPPVVAELSLFHQTAEMLTGVPREFSGTRQRQHLDVIRACEGAQVIEECFDESVGADECSHALVACLFLAPSGQEGFELAANVDRL